MKTDSDLDKIATDIHQCVEWAEGSDKILVPRRLLRSIQIDALREAREIIASGYDDGANSRDYNLGRMAKMIRALELK